jgi:hypothetical protein
MTEAEKRTLVTKIAHREVGQKESPANSNMQKYGAWYGLNGVAWCAIYVSWVFDQAGLKLGKIDTDKGYHYVPSAYNFWKRTSRTTIDPQEGDIVIFDWQGDKLADHTGIFLHWIVKGETFLSIEGNTSISNDSSGGEVMIRIRQLSSVMAFIKPTVYDN